MPVGGLLLFWAIRQFGFYLFENVIDHKFFFPAPYIFGLDYRPIANLVRPTLEISNCDLWFYTVFAENATKATKEYWG